MASIGFMLPITLSQYLVVYDRGFDVNGSWRGYYQAFDELSDAYANGAEVLSGGYGYAIYDLINAKVIVNVASPEALFDAQSILHGV